MTLRTLFSVGIALAGVLASAGCDSGVEEAIALAKLGAECSINSDCASQRVCAFELCHDECADSRDCSDGARCVAGRPPRHVCQLESEKRCSPALGCPGKQVCGSDGSCRDRCRSARDCVSGQVCAQDTCAEPEELTAEGTLPVSDPERVPPCALNSDCAVGLVCDVGRCRAECREDSDCPLDRVCHESRCQARHEPARCAYNSDCDADQRCAQGECVALPEPAECVLDSDCTAPGQHCLGGSCECECDVDADCPTSRHCSGACACVPKRVLTGDVAISTTKDLAQLEDVVRITGALSLNITSPGAVSLRLPTLQQVGSLSASDSSPISYEFGALTDAGDISCNNCVLPALKTAGNITFLLTTWRGQQLSVGPERTVSLPALESVGNITFQGKLAILGFEASNLQSAGDIWLDDSGLVTFSAPALKRARSLKVQQNARLSLLDLRALDLDAPEPEPDGDVTVERNYSLIGLSLPATTALGTLTLTDNSDGKLSFVALDLPHLKHAGALLLHDLGAPLSKLDFGELERVTGQAQFRLARPTDVALNKLVSVGSFHLSGSSDRQSLALPLLATSGTFSIADPIASLTTQLSAVGTLELFSTRLSNLSAFAALQTAGDLRFYGNSQLPSCAPEELSQKLVDWEGAVYADNNKTCVCPNALACCDGAECE